MPNQKTQELLIEILTEELPAIPFLKEWSNIPSKWNAKIAEFGLKADFNLHFTPRRIAIFSRAFPTYTNDEVKEFFGPPLHIAYTNGDKKQGLSNAGQSFLKKAAITQDEIQIATKDGKEVLYAKCVIKGKQSSKILPKILSEFLLSLNFGKSMRWGDARQNGGVSFIRPIVNIMILLGGVRINPLESNLDSSDFNDVAHFGQDYRPATKVHRDKGFEWVEIKGIDDYLEKLESNGIILDENKRKNRILEQIKAIEKEAKLQVQQDSALLEEVVAITEYPTALLGEFQKRFLDLPQEVIQTSAKENQRYFITQNQNGLCNNFVFVANSLSNEYKEIIKGNEKVLRARLSDAEFFYQNDLKSHFSEQGSENPLEHITFVDNLGSMLDKTRREQAIGAFLCEYYGLSKVDSFNVNEALRLTKVDLLSEMVGEFPELQGIMGSYYALESKLDSSIVNAIREQYFPKGEEAILPSSVISAIVAMSGKLDSLFSLFSVGKIPSGSKDPFGLRRAANGVIKICLSDVFSTCEAMKDFSLDVAFLRQIANVLQSHAQTNVSYKDIDLERLQGFFMERLESISQKDFGISTQVFRSVAKSENKQIQAMLANALALEELLQRDDREEVIAVFKRVANIIKDDIKDNVDSSLSSTIDIGLFSEEAEKELFSAFENIAKARQNGKYQNPKEFLEALFGLKRTLEKFFASVLVNDENPRIRANRKALMQGIYNEFKQVGDLKELAI